MCMFKVRYIRPISSLKLGMQSLDNLFSIRVLHFIKKKYRLSISYSWKVAIYLTQNFTLVVFAPGFSFVFSNSISCKSNQTFTIRTVWFVVCFFKAIVTIFSVYI